MSSNRRHEDRLIATFRTGRLRGRRDRSIQIRYYVDFETRVDATCEVLGPLGRALRGRRVLMEHYSGTPERADVHRALAKVHAVAGQTGNGVAGREPDAPSHALVFLCTAGTGHCAGLRLRAHRGHAGWWHGSTLEVDIHVLDGAQLSRDGRWGVLRFALGAPAESHEARRAELLGDPLATTVTKKRIQEAVVNRRIEVPEEERRYTVDGLMAQGRKAGRAEGRAEGRREALLAIAQQVGLPLVELSAVEDVDALQARVTEALSRRG